MYAFCHTRLAKSLLNTNIIIMFMKHNSTECTYNNILANSYEITVHNRVQIAKKRNEIQASE